MLEKIESSMEELLAKGAKIKNRVYDFITHPKTAKFSTLLAMLVFLPAIIIGVIVAQLDPDGYTIVDNYISDLGSFNHTPVPLFLDWGAMITAFLLIPAVFYLDRLFAPYSRDLDAPRESSRLRLRLSSYALLFMLVGLIGLFGIGFFSEDRSNILEPWGVSIGLHGPFSYVVFGGLVIAGIFAGFVVFLYKSSIPRILGIYMIFIPAIPALCFLGIISAPDPRPEWWTSPFWEWMLLFAIVVWLVPSGLVVIQEANKQLAPRK